jgi:hypothetical protein
MLKDKRCGGYFDYAKIEVGEEEELDSKEEYSGDVSRPRLRDEKED